MLVGSGLGIYLSITQEMHPAYIAAFFFGSIILYAPVWSYLLSKWKLWSVQNVKDIDILIHLAHNRNLMYPDNHFYTKYELSSRSHKQQVQKLIERRKKESHIDRYIETYKGEDIIVTSSSFFDRGEGVRLSFNFKGIKFEGKKRIKWSKLTYVKPKIRSGSKHTPAKLWVNYLTEDGHKFRCRVGPVNSLNREVHEIEYLLAIYEKVGRSIKKS